jgi:hypothetical protein
MRHEWAESDESRYGVYRLGPPQTGLRGREPIQVVTCGEDDIGFTLVTLREEGDLTEHDRVGILDGFTGEWLLNPFANWRR